MMAGISGVRMDSNVKEVLAALEGKRFEALNAIGEAAVVHAQDACPVDTGNLRASIMHQVISEDTVEIGTASGYAPYKPVDYAPFVETGTSRMAAQPFLRPAAENYADEYKEIFQMIMER